MANPFFFITEPVAKGQATDTYIKITELLATETIDDPYYKDITHVKRVQVVFQNPHPGGQAKRLDYVITPEMNTTSEVHDKLEFSPRARDIFLMEEVTIIDHDGGVYTLKRERIPGVVQYDFTTAPDVTLNSYLALPVVNPHGAYDGDAVAYYTRNLTIGPSGYLTTAQPCRGLFVYVYGDLSVDGVITMGSRGANVDPDLVGDGNYSSIYIRRPLGSGSEGNTALHPVKGVGPEVEAIENRMPRINFGCALADIPKFGATGGNQSFGPGEAGLHGAAYGRGCTGGGGAGNGYNGMAGGKGSRGTCFAGGTGGGGSSNTGYGGDAQEFGGAGGNGAGGNRADRFGGAGAGNPPGSGQAGIAGGTAGLLVIIVRGNVSINGSGAIHSNGNPGGNSSFSGGGATGGGCVVVMYGGSHTPAPMSATCYTATGGAGGPAMIGYGGNGGDGSVYILPMDERYMGIV